MYGQNPTERILLFIRESKVILTINLLFYTLALLMPLAIQWALTYTNSKFFGNYIDLNAIFSSTLWYALLLLWLAYMIKGYFNIFIKWFYNINILTNERFVDIDFINIFKVRVEETSVMDIEDVKDTQTGLLQSIFELGDLEIFTASGMTTFNLNDVSKASKIRDFIMDVVISERKKRKEIHE